MLSPCGARPVQNKEWTIVRTPRPGREQLGPRSIGLTDAPGKQFLCRTCNAARLRHRQGRLVPDHKTIADFRKDNGTAVRKVCARFVELCREMGLLTKASVAIDGSKFKAVNNRDRNFTRAKVERR